MKEANGLHTGLYLCEEYESIITSNFRSNLGLNNGAKSEVVDSIYKNEEIKTIVYITESVVANF